MQYMNLQPVTNKQKGLVILISRFRFLDSNHIQSFAQHKDKRRTNSWLQNLTDKQYLIRYYDNRIIGKNRIPAIYSLGARSIRLLKAQGIGNNAILHKLYFEKDRSETFIHRCLLLATICCKLDQKKNGQVSYDYTIFSDMENPDNLFNFLIHEGLSIDLCIKKDLHQKEAQYYLLNIFDESLPRYRVRKRIRAYKELFFSNSWENKIKAPFPTLLFISKTKAGMINMKRYTKKVFEEDYPEIPPIYFSTADIVKAEGITGDIWEGI
jgi:hypothetical protein